MLTSRQKLILKAIIDLYLETAEPVGSKALMNLPYLTFSSATLRYDMATLEEFGFLDKTHTSSGRIPTEKGYKYYVEHLVTPDYEVMKIFPLVDEIFAKNMIARDRTVQEALNLLSEITKYTAVAVGPDAEHAFIKKIDFIPLNNQQAIILIVTNKGHVQHQQIQIAPDMSMYELREVIKTLDDILRNRSIDEAIGILKAKQSHKELKIFMNYQAQLIDSFIQAFSKFAQDSFYLSGITNVFNQPEFSNVEHIKRFMDMLERREIVKLIGTQEGLTIRFSSEMDIIPLDQMTIVSVPYDISETERGTIALLGPARMAYQKVIPLLEYIAANLGKLYQNEEDEE